jgi:tetratricopeptide (TPR) repeat protein
MPSIPFDVSYELRDGLRAEPSDAVSMRAAVDWLEEQAEQAENLPERARLLGAAGAYAGMLRQLDRAQRLLRPAIAVADQTNKDRQRVVLRIRLADVLALDGDSDAAIELLLPLLKVCQDGADLVHLVDFVHQHLGKALIEAGQHAAAMAHLKQALELRERKADPELLASTLEAMAAARRMTQPG